MSREVSNDICGSTLGADVRNVHGQVLLTRDTLLTLGHVRTLRMWGIHRVVLANEVQTTASRSPMSRQLLERCAVHERRRFVCCDLGHPAMHQCYLLAVRRRAERCRDHEHGVSDD